MIRKFQTEDLEQVAEIWLDSNREAHGFIPGRYWEEQLPLVKTLLPQAELFVFQDGDGALQGFVGLAGEHIEGIFVRGPARSLGIGKQLLDHVKAARSRLTLNVYRKNDRAAAFYRREGFRVQSEGADGNTGEIERRMVWERSAPC